MASQASNLLPICFRVLTILLISASSNAWSALPLDTEVTELLQKKDWPSLVLLLQPKKGQNFEHDLILAKALLSLERRQEALKLLSALEETHKDDRVNKLLQTAGTLFFNQETSTLYYESLDLIRTLQFKEAKDHLEQGLAKEPGHVLMLSRLVQLQLLFNQDEAANANLRALQATHLNFPEWKLFAARLAVDKKVLPDDEAEENLVSEFTPIKAQLFENEVTLTYWLQALTRTQRGSEIESLANRVIRDHPSWTYALLGLAKNESVSPETKTKLLALAEKNLKKTDTFLAQLETEMKLSQYFWVGYVNEDTLRAEFKNEKLNEVGLSPVPRRE